MPHPTTDPTVFVLQAALSPSDPTLPATKEGVEAIDGEIKRLKARASRLLEAKENIVQRMNSR